MKTRRGFLKTAAAAALPIVPAQAAGGGGVDDALALFELRSAADRLAGTAVRPRAMVSRRPVPVAAAGALALRTGAAAAPPLDPVPPLPATPSPGRRGDFDFLAGEWRIQHFWRASPADDWLKFAGEATCWTLLGGAGSVEELRIPVRDFNGMGLRLLDVDKRVWSDYWVNAKSGVLAREGQRGSFEGGAGIFIGDDDDGGHPVKAGGVWDRITPSSCRWRQVLSRDAGRTWAHTWVMHWRRA